MPLGAAKIASMGGTRGAVKARATPKVRTFLFCRLK